MSYNASAEDRQLDTVFRKLNADEFAPLTTFLQQQAKQASDTLAKGTEPATLYRMQGRYAAFMFLLEKIASNRK